jgi:hypothetical protein
MARQTKTPGVTEAPATTETEVATQTTTVQDDAALDAILGTPDSKDADTSVSTEATSTPSEPVKAEPTNAELLEIINGLKSQIASQNAATTKPVAPHVPTSGVASEPVAKRTRPVLTPHGWTIEEY